MHKFAHTQTNIGPRHCKKRLRQSACCAIYSWHTSHSFDFALATMSSKDPSVLLPDFFAQISLPCMSECSCSVCKVNNSHSDHEQIKSVQVKSCKVCSGQMPTQPFHDLHSAWFSWTMRSVDECTSVQCAQFKCASVQSMQMYQHSVCNQRLPTQTLT